MDDTFDLDMHAPVPEPEDQALKALLQRPGFSIRSRLALGFFILFMLAAIITITSIFTLYRLESKLRFLEASDSFTSEIQQARRFEKNYFLYGSDLDHVAIHVGNAQNLLVSEEKEWNSVVGRDNVATMKNHLNSYKDLIRKLEALDKAREPGAAPDYPQIESRLRTHGAKMVSFAMDLSHKERFKINRMLHIARLVPVAFLVCLLVIMVYQADFLSRHIIRRLNRLMKATQNVADGDFTPIMPHRRFRDEFTNLAVAMNSMMSQLVHRHEILVRSHKLRAVGTLTAGVAHELNNPINNIMLTAEMLKEDFRDLSDEECEDMINDLVEQAERAQKIVRNLLDFARESEIETELLDMGDIMRETLALAANQIKLHNVKLIVDMAPNLPPVHGDKQHLSQVFLNLILNALDAMPQGGRLTIHTGQNYSPSFLDIEISDTGKGIPEHIIDSIFDPFFTTKPTGKGTGLGLSVSLGIVRKHGGAIRVQSSVGAGTTFQVLLPISTVPADLRHVNADAGAQHPNETQS
jgi:signal transduction histidine kinase